MDLLSIAGIVLGILAIVGGNAIEGGHLSGLLNLPALVIVLGGTLGAVMLQAPLASFSLAFRRLRWAFMPPALHPREHLDKIILWSTTARRDGLLGLEGVSERETDTFSRKGLQLLVDGVEPPVIRAVLEIDLAADEERDILAAKVFESMGGYAPTIGILGAVMGLIHVMGNLADPERLGSGIATAFVATIYGVGFANLVFLPVAAKLKAVVRMQSRQREMIIEGLLAIAEGENPKTIEMKLEGYL